MPEAREQLIRTNADIRFVRVDVGESLGSAVVHFDLTDEDRSPIGTLKILVEPTANGSIADAVARAHRRVIGILRKWEEAMDTGARTYERQHTRTAQPEGQ